MKKVLSFLIAVSMVLSLGLVSWAEEPEEEYPEEYVENAEPAMEISLKEYAENNDITEDPALEEMDGGDPYSPFPVDKAIFGTNDLYSISDRNEYPYSAVAKIFSHFRCGCSCSGTGFMISASGLMTSAQLLVCSDHHKTADSLTFYFGYKGPQNYGYKYDKGTTYWYGTDNIDKDGREWDYGYVKLKERVGDRTGWFGTRVMSDSSFDGSIFSIAGFSDNNLYYDIDKVTPYNDYLLHHKIDTVPGMAGSPLFTFDCYAFAINVAYTSTTNIARRITSKLQSQMRDNGLF